MGEKGDISTTLNDKKKKSGYSKELMRRFRNRKNHYMTCERKVTRDSTKYILSNAGGLVRLLDTKYVFLMGTI